MSKPDFVSSEEYQRMLEMAREIIVQNLPPHMVTIYLSSPEITARTDRVAAAGIWLGIKLREIGLNEKQAVQVCQAFGRACLNVKDAWVLAWAVIQTFKECPDLS